LDEIGRINLHETQLIIINTLTKEGVL